VTVGRGGVTVRTTTVKWATVLLGLAPFVGVPLTWYVTRETAAAVTEHRIMALEVKALSHDVLLTNIANTLSDLRSGLARIEGRLSREGE
jgi:hypothetical protein